MKRFKVGEIVRISEGSGTYTGKLVRIVSWDEIVTDGSGIPQNVPGAYSMIDPQREAPIQFLEYPGEFGLMHKNRLQRFQEYRRGIIREMSVQNEQ